MPKKEIKQVMINGRLIGIFGLDEAINEIAEISKGLSDDEIQKKLLELISRNNYVPANIEEAYGKAAWREFEIVQGLPVAPEYVAGFKIAVLGMGLCPLLPTRIRCSGHFVGNENRRRLAAYY